MEKEKMDKIAEVMKQVEELLEIKGVIGVMDSMVQLNAIAFNETFDNPEIKEQNGFKHMKAIYKGIEFAAVDF